MWKSILSIIGGLFLEEVFVSVVHLPRAVCTVEPPDAFPADPSQWPGRRYDRRYHRPDYTVSQCDVCDPSPEAKRTKNTIKSSSLIFVEFCVYSEDLPLLEYKWPRPICKPETRESRCKWTRTTHPRHSHWMAIDQSAFHRAELRKTTNPRFDYTFRPKTAKIHASYSRNFLKEEEASVICLNCARNTLIISGAM